MALKVIGHINPDSDTVCSPIAYAWYLSNKKDTHAKAFIAGPLNKETAFILNHFGIETPEILKHFTADDKVIIMDTNNPDELLPGFEKAKIRGIIDHHKLVGGLQTEEPLMMVTEPIACTATIAWHIMQREGHTDIPKEIAGIMLCAILSDTLKFTSPTTTEQDKKAAQELAHICGEDIDSLAENMFAAKSDLTGMSLRDILTVDSKVFEFGGKKVRLSVLETTKPENALQMIPALENEMTAMRHEEKLDHTFFFVVDILNTQAHLIVTTEEERLVAEEAFDAKFEGESLLLPGVVSRKKQIIPALEPVIAGE